MRLLILALLLAPPAAGAETFWDTTFTYFARENVEDNDNDIIRGTAGITLEDGQGGWRGEVALGIRNEFFEGDYALDYGAAGLRFYSRDDGAWWAGGRVRGVEDGDVSGELLVGLERYWGPLTARGLAGVQALSDEDGFDDGRQVSGLALAEVSYYPFDIVSFRSSLTLDDADLLGAVGGELKLGRLPVSLFADWTVAVDGYRNDEFYNDFFFGFRITPNFASLRDRDRSTLIRALDRPVDPLQIQGRSDE
ncbi:MAG: hypothetical protein AAF913_02730 [Pseudomonadota bacterium]